MENKSAKITASNLYDYYQCPHRVWRDKHGDQSEKDKEVNPFVKLLWEKGISHERDVIKELGEFKDISDCHPKDAARETIKAMKSKTPLIYQGVLEVDELRGIPDLLQLQPDGKYVPIDIKSGSALEGETEDEDSGKPKKYYAAQLALYCDALERLGFSSGRRGAILDKRKRQIIYDLNAAQGVRNKVSWWDEYKKTLQIVKGLIENTEQNKPALAGICKLCPWQKSCKKWAEQVNDPTNLFYTGRKVRDALERDFVADTVDDLLDLDIPALLKKKKEDKQFLYGLGESTLKKINQRAQVMQQTKEPVVYDVITFPEVEYELFFDIENDPTQDMVYLHGIYVRSSEGEEFKSFISKDNTSEQEKAAWQAFWDYIRTLKKGNYAIYYYSAHEKTTYKMLRELYPDVVSEDELEEFFDKSQAVDLYTDVILKHTDFPLTSYSVKAIATYLGFKWRDVSPSGALSIEWYNKYLETGDDKIMQRILDYNEDDCKAMMVIKDYLKMK